MINPKLLNPKSIVVVGASNDVTKPGGKLLKNLLDSRGRYGADRPLRMCRSFHGGRI